ncbi:MAG: WecB/TagA/CpsF family glycosyltransferase [Anaerolineae bacterium]|nr:WecB/TagA/CpsF family glycosyltransferase [Anaerolineae bacterium]MDW8070353.1 WecB/TagA/CpsF family glycosyltransferase [Anaerolineae bacterium]
MSDVSSVYILGVRVDRVTFQQTLALIETFIAQGTPHQIVTVNPEFVMLAQRNPTFRQVINQSALALPDGIGVWWASRYLGCPVPERVPGVDLVVRLAQLSAHKGYRMYFLGAMPGVAARAAAVLQARFPGAVVAGSYSGSPRLEENTALVERIRAKDPDILFVAFGAPAQDLWIARNLETLSVPVCMGVGGSFDYIAGVRPLAPQWMRNLGLEWLYRLITQPWRWRRMLALPLFVWYVCWSRWNRKNHRLVNHSLHL